MSVTDDTHNQPMFNFTSSQLSKLTPSMRVALLLHFEEEDTPLLFIEMSELIKNEKSNEWRESSRWIKFEEDVEGDWTRWSKPHVATLSLPNITELRSCILNGIFLMDADFSNLNQIFEKIITETVKSKLIAENKKSELQNLLCLPAVQFIKKSSKWRCKNPCSKDEDNTSINNFDMLRRLPINIEVCNILVGEVEFLQKSVAGLIRLKNSIIFEKLSEIPAPTKIIFILLCPKGHLEESKRIGRTLGTMLTDEVFRKIMYTTKIREHIIDGIDEFLSHVTIIPPGAWDTNSRLEPPEVMHTHEKRLQKLKHMVHHSKNHLEVIEDFDEDHESDPTLKRTGRLCGGLIEDIKRKIPWYKSDFTDALDMQCVATILFMYFALLAPIVTFGGLLEDATNQRMGAIENILSGALCGVIYSLFSGQPLTIIGSTGPILVFETILYDVCTNFNFEYLPFRFWVYIWTAVILFMIVITDLSALVSYITRFTEESFATLIAIIFIYEALLKMVKIGNHLDMVDYLDGDFNDSCQCILKNYTSQNDSDPNTTMDVLYTVPLRNCSALKGQYIGTTCHTVYDKLLMSLLLMIGTFFISTKLKELRHSCYFPTFIRRILSDFAVMIAIVLMTSIDIQHGPEEDGLLNLLAQILIGQPL
uniref:Anion exchange protein n=1 Tax=Acrobeloides nanus TaxID=290746 RepID=A0A914CDR6_9BILA